MTYKFLEKRYFKVFFFWGGGGCSTRFISLPYKRSEGLSRDVYFSFVLWYFIMIIFIIIFKFKFKFFCYYYFLTIGNVAKPRTHNVDEKPNSTENQMASHVAKKRHKCLVKEYESKKN